MSCGEHEKAAKTEHTPEPWEHFNGYLIRHVVGDYAAPIAEMRTPYRYGIGIVRGEHEQQANARRIVACVNACKGISIEDLEMDNAKFVQALRERNALRDQRDELLAALEQFATWGRMQHKAQSKGCHATFDMMALKDEIDLAEAAIASVKEK